MQFVHDSGLQTFKQHACAHASSRASNRVRAPGVVHPTVQGQPHSTPRNKGLRCAGALYACWQLSHRTPHLSACPAKLAALGVKYASPGDDAKGTTPAARRGRERRTLYDAIERATWAHGLQIGRAKSQGVSAADLFRV